MLPMCWPWRAAYVSTRCCASGEKCVHTVRLLMTRTASCCSLLCAHAALNGLGGSRAQQCRTACRHASGRCSKDVGAPSSPGILPGFAALRHDDCSSGASECGSHCKCWPTFFLTDRTAEVCQSRCLTCHVRAGHMWLSGLLLLKLLPGMTLMLLTCRWPAGPCGCTMRPKYQHVLCRASQITGSTSGVASLTSQLQSTGSEVGTA